MPGDNQTPQLHRHRGKVAIVTGAGSPRVGNCIARYLAAHGFSVAIHFRSAKEHAERTVEELLSAGLSAAAFQADLTNPEEVQSFFDAVAKHFGRLDLLVNTASIWRPCPLEEITLDELHEQYDANVSATFLCCQAAAKLMVSQPEGGVIINIGDWAVVRPYRDYTAYFAAKGAIPTLTRALAIELAARNPNIRVNAILPGPVLLPANTSEEERHRVAAATLVKRVGKPENVAHAVLFLFENDFVTGVCLPVDGGRTLAR